MFKSLLILGGMFIGSYSFAGPGGGHSHGPIDPCKKLATSDLKKSSVEIGQCHIRRLIKKGKINSSWSSASHKESVAKEFKGRREWVVTFDNQKGVKGKTLYIFLNLRGGFIAANFTGK